MDYPMQQKQLDDFGEEPAVAGGQGAPGAGDAGGRRLAYCIEVYVYEDGTFRVTKESPQDEAAEHAEAGTEEGAGGKDYDTPGQVLQAVLEALRANPVGEAGQAQFSAGFEQR